MWWCMPPHMVAPKVGDSPTTRNGAKHLHMWGRIKSVAWGSPVRKVVTVLAAVFVLPAWILNFERLMEANGWDRLLADNVPLLLQLLEALLSDTFRWLVVGGAAALLMESGWRFWRQRQMQTVSTPLPPESPADTRTEREKVMAARRSIGDINEQIGRAKQFVDRAYGSSDRDLGKRYQNARPLIEAALTVMQKAGIPTPPLSRFDIPEIDQLSQYLHQIEPFLDRDLYGEAQRLAAMECTRISKWSANRT